MSIRITRREALQILGVTAGLAAAGTTGRWARHAWARPNFAKIPVRLHGANIKVGHLLRDAIAAVPTSVSRTEVVIVGGGISGLSAGWFLQKNGLRDFQILELDARPGGNSVSGQNEVSSYPWAAHYVPLPSPEATEVRELFEELGVITGYERGLPVYNEFYLCADPHERLFDKGVWSEGLIPNVGLSNDERSRMREFFQYTDGLKNRRGADGRVIFAIPLEHSSRDPEWLKLDRMSMADFLTERGWNLPRLRWYIDYCCRDDYGFRADRVSAWAGLHYFAARSGEAANADPQTVITWPEGNGWLADRLSTKLADQLRVNRLVYRISESAGQSVEIDVIHTTDGRLERIRADQVIYAGPRFTAGRVIKGLPALKSPAAHAPWIVANVTVEKMPATDGAPLSWDNVSTYGESLGYIVANHQDLTILHQPKVLTYYRPLDEEDETAARRRAQTTTPEEWREFVLRDLEGMHPGIHREVRGIDVWIWGHGMPSPGINYLWSEDREERLRSFGRVHFAHSDQSGISVFEEAQYRGVAAARRVLASRARPRGART